MSGELISVAEAAKISGYHPERIRELIREKKIEAQKFATVWQVDKSSLLKYLDKMEKKGNKRGPKQRKSR